MDNLAVLVVAIVIMLMQVRRPQLLRVLVLWVKEIQVGNQRSQLGLVVEAQEQRDLGNY
jgi:hypothetical protein